MADHMETMERMIFLQKNMAMREDNLTIKQVLMELELEFPLFVFKHTPFDIFDKQHKTFVLIFIRFLFIIVTALLSNRFMNLGINKQQHLYLRTKKLI